ncbi:dihydroxyacetone kinase family protein [Ornithinimicrobium tianjinense]|uniref:L-erythrulose kinase n=1 Tax=Ornithinimicrobium tianjinense TaxID=1195761 RepID=A0A917F372_9MICO|nr:dihydroxyacetone kinase family protein [Ornithinimicrobium tianjinense]GGF40479.1 L-erythrulose kinase [Ornithinimicrobium tianjinense]
MTWLLNDPADFAREALEGFCAAHPEYVQAVRGGVLRATASPEGEVALVVGGGSGHYPAFAGWVGPGMAHAAVCGNLFASPSASQAHSVVSSVDNGGGVVLAFGNYAGDVLHFGQAAERLRAEGVDVRVVTVSDDVASNTPDKHRDRRGIAGDLPVVKTMGAAIARGADLDEVERLGWKANDATRTLGVAFDGCTLPGQDAPLFSLRERRMGVGLGIHGEPGVREEPLASAAEVADLLVDGVLAEEPSRGAGYAGRAAVILNGLGTVKYEELFVVYRRVAQRLQDAGITPVQPEVGELVTSLDMAGLSLTLVYLDDELESLWVAPADTPAFRRGEVRPSAPRRPPLVEEEGGQEPVPPSSEASRRAARTLLGHLEAVAESAKGHESHFATLDSVAGDGDHGQGMSFGSKAAHEAARAAVAEGAGARTTLVRAGAAWADAAGGTSGALWGALLTAAGGALSDESDETTKEDVIRAAEAGGQAVLRLGGAAVGDKTMVDALVPFLRTLRSEASGGADEAWRAAATHAHEAAESTADLVARRGRSRVLGERSLGTPDPGAISFAVLMSAVAERLGREETS